MKLKIRMLTNEETHKKIDYDTIFVNAIHPVYRKHLEKIKLDNTIEITILYPDYIIDGHHRIAKIIENKIPIEEIEYKVDYITNKKWLEIFRGYIMPLRMIYKKIAIENNLPMEDKYKTYKIKYKDKEVLIDDVHILDKPIEVELEKEYTGIYMEGEADASDGWAHVYIFKFKIDLKNKKSYITYQKYIGKYITSYNSPFEFYNKESISKKKEINLAHIYPIIDKKQYFSQTIILSNYDYNNIDFEIDNVNYNSIY